MSLMNLTYFTTRFESFFLTSPLDDRYPYIAVEFQQDDYFTTIERSVFTLLDAVVATGGFMNIFFVGFAMLFSKV
jgi:hypothetical protein